MRARSSRGRRTRSRITRTAPHGDSRHGGDHLNLLHKAGTTVAVPAAVPRTKETFDKYLNNFEEEIDSEEGRKEGEAKGEKEEEDDEVREDDEVVEDEEVKEMEHDTTPHYNLRSSV